MPVAFEERYSDVLQNIESGIVGVYLDHAELTDADALHAVEALIRVYQAEAKPQAAFEPRLPPPAQPVFEAIHAMCEWRLGRKPLLGQGQSPELPPKTVEEMIACLKHIRRSIERWNKRGGQRGYLDSVSQYV
jgi:hypothetical protein